jgi:hypothetical protein
MTTSYWRPLDRRVHRCATNRIGIALSVPPNPEYTDLPASLTGVVTAQGCESAAAPEEYCAYRPPRFADSARVYTPNRRSQNTSSEYGRSGTDCQLAVH